MNNLQQKYPEEIETILNKYPQDHKRSAVMSLLYLAQRENGYVSRHDLDDIAEITGISSTDVASIIGFYSLFHDDPGGKVRIQICTDLPCALRGAEEFLAQLCEYLGITVGETTADGKITVEEVKCLAGCDKAPLFQVQTSDGLSYHENQTLESAKRLIDSWR